MRLKLLFLPTLITLAFVLLSGNARAEVAGGPNQRFTRQSSGDEHASAPNLTSTVVGAEKKESSNQPTRREQEPVRVIVSPFTIQKDFIDKVTPALTFFFTAALVFVGYRQWRTYEAQRVIQREQTILTHRPRIHVREVHLIGRLAVDKPIAVCLSLINMGETQATIISSNFTVDIWNFLSTPYRQLTEGFEMPEPYDGDIHYFEDQLGYSRIGAGFQTVPVLKHRKLALQPHEQRQWASYEKTVFVYGYIFYRNDAGQHHKTGFCRVYDRNSERFSSVVDQDLEYEY